MLVVVTNRIPRMAFEASSRVFEHIKRFTKLDHEQLCTVLCKLGGEFVVDSLSE